MPYIVDVKFLTDFKFNLTLEKSVYKEIRTTNKLYRDFTICA